MARSSVKSKTKTKSKSKPKKRRIDAGSALKGQLINIALTLAANETGTCYAQYNCQGYKLGEHVTGLACRAMGGRSWKGDYDGASCISGIN